MASKRRIAARSPPLTDSEEEHARKRIRSSSVASESDDSRILKIYIVPAKVDEKELQELFHLVDNQTDQGKDGCIRFELTSNHPEADVIITNLRMKKRFERHIPWNVARQKSIVTPAWLRQSIRDCHPAECGQYAAFQELHDTTTSHCPTDNGQDHKQEGTSGLPYSLLPPAQGMKLTPRSVFENWKAKYACQRASPMVCLNQTLASELNVLARARELEGLSMNALSYEKSIIKSYPFLITQKTFERDIKNLTGLGGKTLFKIQEFLDKGFIEESRETSSSERFQCLSLFASIYGIGPVNARKLYDLGVRTIQDLERYYDLPSREGGSTAFSAGVIENELVVMTPNGKRVPLEALRTGKGKGPGRDNVLPDLSVKIGLMLRDELDLPIPREEVEEIHRVVTAELEKLQPACVSTIVGGYRRGKEKSNDVDIVIGHPDLKSGSYKVKGLCKRFVQHLHSKGMVTHVMHLSSFHAPNTLRTSHRDSLEKALTVFVLPPNEKDPHQKRVRRRLDLIFAAPESYWTAVIGWSGSRLFERDLRSWAKNAKGLKFDSSGLTRRHDSRLFVPRSEEEIFGILGLDWIDPTMRNANA